MEQVDMLKSKGFRVVDLNNKRNELIKRWRESFVKDIHINRVAWTKCQEGI